MEEVSHMKRESFNLGLTVATIGVQSLFTQHEISMFLGKHSRCDWGDLCEDDKAINNQALTEGGQLLSSYKTSKGKVWVITDANRSTTTVLLPSEY